MSDHSWMQVKWVIDRLFDLLKLLIWPAFLWFFSKREDVRQHIQLLLSRELRIKVPGADVKVTSAERSRPLPAREPEKVLADVPESRS